MLSPLIDNSDDWRRLRDRGYASDELLRRCDVHHKTQLARHILCVLIHHDEIIALTGSDEEPDNGVTTRLRRHFAELKSNKPYREAYAAMVASADWSILETFFEQALAQMSPQRTLHY
uniref:Uncharacterized protein n=1 Tax=Peronospora matthiolae TaxID=2874970 RepID=A0AAV1TTF7_9STRA